jgi:uncharacterized protein
MKSMNKPKKRFIAGATCTQCHEIDTLFVVEINQNQTLHCVECGYSEQKEVVESSANIIGLFSPEGLSKK